MQTVHIRRWAKQDPTLVNLLPEIFEDATSPEAKPFYKHWNACPKCNDVGSSVIYPEPNC